LVIVHGPDLDFMEFQAHSVLRDIRELAVEAGSVENAPTTLSPDAGEIVREMVTVGKNLHLMPKIFSMLCRF
jgi:hypothetical protein